MQTQGKPPPGRQRNSGNSGTAVVHKTYSKSLKKAKKQRPTFPKQMKNPVFSQAFICDKTYKQAKL